MTQFLLQMPVKLENPHSTCTPDQLATDRDSSCFPQAQSLARVSFRIQGRAVLLLQCCRKGH